jgi:hypothetical protein
MEGGKGLALGHAGGTWNSIWPPMEEESHPMRLPMVARPRPEKTHSGAGEAAKTGAGVDDEVQGAGRKLIVAPVRSKRGRSKLAMVGPPGG